MWAETNPRPPDLRRATSREAARKRRRVESDIFGDMSRLLPLQPSISQRLDKPSIIRLTLSYIRAHALLKGSVHAHAGAKQTGGWLDGDGDVGRRRFWTLCSF